MLRIPDALEEVNAQIETVALYRVDVHAARHFSFGTWHHRQHAILSLGVGAMRGWGEAICGRDDTAPDLAAWGACFADLKGLTVAQALNHLHSRREEWALDRLEIAEMALLDLGGGLCGTPALTLLGLAGRAPVAGLYCILEADPQQAQAAASRALSRNLKTHVKVKIFGKEPLDTRIIAAVRKVMGPDAFLLADANSGYLRRAGASVDDLVPTLRHLREVGLDACEDPARLSNEEWVALQARVGNLALVPDAPMRTAWKAIDAILPDMGHVYNLHPGSMGSPIDAVALGRKIQSFGAGVMVGDDSLIGPACTAWQQIAIGLGAAWVEALEKPEESDVFLNCVTSQATAQEPDGRLGIRELRPGFGLEVDAARLRQECGLYHAL